MVLSRDVVSALSEAGVPSALTTRSPTLSPTNGGLTDAPAVATPGTWRMAWSISELTPRRDGKGIRDTPMLVTSTRPRSRPVETSASWTNV